MKYVFQFFCILMFCLLGELLHDVIPLPVPSSIYGLILLLLALTSGLLPLSAVKETGHFLVEIMPLLFIPSAVGLMDSWDVLKPLCLPYMVIIVCSTLLVMVISGRLTQRILRYERKDDFK